MFSTFIVDIGQCIFLCYVFIMMICLQKCLENLLKTKYGLSCFHEREEDMDIM